MCSACLFQLCFDPGSLAERLVLTGAINDVPPAAARVKSMMEELVVALQMLGAFLIENALLNRIAVVRHSTTS